jgi:hypothetical protein
MLTAPAKRTREVAWRNRRLLPLAFTLALLPCLAIVMLWVRSYRSVDLYVFGYWNLRPHPMYGMGARTAEVLRLGSCDGQVLVQFGSGGCGGPTAHPSGPGLHGQRWARETVLNDDQVRHRFFRARQQDWRWLGLRYQTLYLWQGRQMPLRSVIVPDAWLTLASLVPPAALTRFRPRRRPGFCRICGYDLRATPLRCPECGAHAAADSNASSFECDRVGSRSTG